MAARKKVVYRYRNRTKKRRSRPKRRLSLLTVGGMIAGATTSLSGRTPIIGAVQRGISGEYDWQTVGADVTRELIGYDSRFAEGKWSLPTFTTMTVLGALGSKIAGKFVKPSTFDAIPYIGKKIKL